jgi:hypothetical protein
MRATQRSGTRGIAVNPSRTTNLKRSEAVIVTSGPLSIYRVTDEVARATASTIARTVRSAASSIVVSQIVRYEEFPQSGCTQPAGPQRPGLRDGSGVGGCSRSRTDVVRLNLLLHPCINLPVGRIACSMLLFEFWPNRLAVRRLRGSCDENNLDAAGLCCAHIIRSCR